MCANGSDISLDNDRLLRNFVDLLSVDSYYGDEERVVAVIRPIMEPAGVAFRLDSSGNLIGVWAAQGKSGPPIMLNAHMDTVWPTPGMVPVVRDDGVYSDGSSVLGADDKAGVAAILEAVLAVHDAGLEHGPVELVFTVGEDVGHIGSKAFDPAEIESRVSFVFDAGGPVGTVVTRAPGSRSFTATFHGKAAHAGIAPETGISAIAMMARAIDRMPLGRIDAETVANVGTVEGGQAQNIVPDKAQLVAQARSLDERRLEAQVAAMQDAMDSAADEFGGRVEVAFTLAGHAYQLDDDNPAVARADAAIRAAGLKPEHVPTGGGSDAAEFNSKGIASACLGMGYEEVHSVDEFMPHAELRWITQIGAQLIAGA